MRKTSSNVIFHAQVCWRLAAAYRPLPKEQDLPETIQHLFDQYVLGLLDQEFTPKIAAQFTCLIAVSRGELTLSDIAELIRDADGNPLQHVTVTALYYKLIPYLSRRCDLLFSLGFPWIFLMRFGVCVCYT